MKLPRDLSGKQLARLLEKYGYTITRQTGSHLRLTTRHAGDHHITIPNHSPIKIGTLASIIGEIADHFKVNKQTIYDQIF